MDSPELIGELLRFDGRTNFLLRQSAFIPWDWRRTGWPVRYHFFINVPTGFYLPPTDGDQPQNFAEPIDGGLAE